MKVRVTVTVDIDAESWDLNYGIPADRPDAIRADVREYVQNLVTQHLHDLGVAA